MKTTKIVLWGIIFFLSLGVGTGWAATVATPVINPRGGAFEDPISVSITTATPGAIIYYTTDGSEPNRSSWIYTAPFILNSSATVKTKAYKKDFSASDISRARFSITKDAVCGNGICESSENQSSCPGDCIPPGDLSVAICPWNGQGVKLFGQSCTDPSGCSFEVYQYNPSQGYANVRCFNNASPCSDSNWLSCQSPVQADGLIYSAFTIDKVGVFVRYNAVSGNPSSNQYSSVVVTHSGGGGSKWIDNPRNDILNDPTDFYSLQKDYGMRVVGISWTDAGINSGGSTAGRWLRTSSTGISFFDADKRIVALFEWIDQHLNADSMPIGFVGSSGGADAVVSLLNTGSYLISKAKYLGVLSYAPLYNFINACTEITSTCTYVNPVDGIFGKLKNTDPGNCPVIPNGVGATIKKSTGGNVALPDYVWNTNDCQNGTVNLGNPLIANSNDDDLLQAQITKGGPIFSGVFHASVATQSSAPGMLSDNGTGVTWAMGNIYHHSALDKAKKVWLYCPNQTHASQLADQTSPCFDDVYQALIDTLITGQ